MQIPYETVSVWPPIAEPTKVCPICNKPMGEQPNFRYVLLGYRQLIPGKDAVEAADCLYTCQNCHVVEYVRVIKA